MTRRTLIAAALLAAVLVVPVRAGAATAITLRLNDGFAVKGTSIVCAVQISKTLIPGEKLLDCFIATRKGPVPKTYTVAIAVNGEVALGQVQKAGGVKIVMKRGGGPLTKASPSSRKGRLYQAQVGTAVLVKGTAVTCAVAKQKFGGKSTTTVACFKVNGSKKPRPGSYGIGITDGGAFLVQFDANSKGAPIKVVQHGH
jgi:hypothetical protein